MSKIGLAGTVLLLVAGVVVTGCGSSSPAASSSKNGPWVIGISNGYYGNAARVQYEAEAKAYAALPGVSSKIKKLVINNAGMSVAGQISAVDGMIAQHVNAIILDSNSLTALNPAISAAKRAGIPVIAANDQVSSPIAHQVETVGQQFGATMAQGFASLLNGHGNIVVLRGIAGNPVDAAEASGFSSVLSKYPGIHVLATVYPQWDDAQAQQAMANLLSRYNKIDGVFTEGGMQQGVVRAFVAAHRKLVPVTGTDENGFACQVKQYHAQGLNDVQVGTAIYAYALALKSAISLLSGGSLPHTIPIHWTAWNTAQSIQNCQPQTAPSLFLQVADPTDGINLTPVQVQQYMH